MYWYLLSFRTPEYVHLCLCCITMNIETIVFIYVCTYGHFKRWWILQTLYLLSFIAYRSTWILSLLSLKVLNALSPFTIFYHVLLHEMCWMYYRIVLMYCNYTCFVRNDEIKMSNQSINCALHKTIGFAKILFFMELQRCPTNWLAIQCGAVITPWIYSEILITGTQ